MKLLLIALAVALCLTTVVLYKSTTNEVIRPYNGVGSTVLKSGTVIEGEYTGPKSIIGHIDRPGTWTIE